jgi:hypothetical protein
LGRAGFNAVGPKEQKTAFFKSGCFYAQEQTLNKWLIFPLLFCSHHASTDTSRSMIRPGISKETRYGCIDIDTKTAFDDARVGIGR